MASRGWSINVLRESIRSGCCAGQRSGGLIPRHSGLAVNVKSVRPMLDQACLIGAKSKRLVPPSWGNCFVTTSEFRHYGTIGTSAPRKPSSLPLVLNDEELNQCMATLSSSGWHTQGRLYKPTSEGENAWPIKRLEEVSTEFTFKQYSIGIELVRLIGGVAEKMNHHPTLELSYSSLIVRVHTHLALRCTEPKSDKRSRGPGITTLDIDFAKQVDQVLEDMKQTGRIRVIARPYST